MCVRITFHRNFRPGLLVQKSNAGGRISKLFVEKKIFYSLDFLLVTIIKKQRIFFAQLLVKNKSANAVFINAESLYQQAFHKIH